MFEGNRLLRSIEPAVRPLFAGRMQPVEMRRGEVLLSPGAELDRVYFPLSGLVGLVSDTAEGDALDSSTVGREGAVGVFEACGTRRFLVEAVVQVPGEAVRMAASTYRDLFGASSSIRTAVHCYVEELMSETRQFVVCNALHGVEARLARVLLESLDKSGAVDRLPLTQRALARMLGVQRSTVAETMSKLQRQNVVASRRGGIIIADRAALEALSCSCRAAIAFTRRAIATSQIPACDEVIAA